MGLLVGPLIATSEVAAETLVLESYAGERPREADRILAPLRSELEKQGFVAAPAEVTKVLRSYRALPTRMEEEVTARQLTEAFERAHGDWLDGRFDRAAPRLDAMIKTAHLAPIVLAAEQKTRALLFSALLSLAQARKRQGQQAKSEEAMAELIRSFPNQLITRGEHGPEAYELYSAVRRALDMEGRGALVIKVDVPCVIFVDEELRPQESGSAKIADLVAGEYRLLIKSSNEPSRYRYYRVAVRAHEVARLEINWALDSVLVSDDWVGFRFDTTLRQGKEADAALRIARDTAARTVATVRLAVDKQQKLIEVNLYELQQNTKICGGRVRLSGGANDASYLAGLAHTLASCLPLSENQTLKTEPDETATRKASQGDGLPWVPDDPPKPPSKPQPSIRKAR